MLLGVTPAAAAPTSMSVVNVTLGAVFDDVITATIPAVGSGNSLVIITSQDKTEITVDGATEDSETAGLYGNPVHFFHIDNVTDSRTSLTIRAFVSGVPANTSMNWAVIELDASSIVTASTAALTSQTSTSALSASFTTTADNATAIGYANYNNGPTTTTGTSGYTAEDDASGYNAVIYNADVGATGAKSMTATLSASRGLVTVVQAYAAA